MKKFSLFYIVKDETCVAGPFYSIQHAIEERERTGNYYIRGYDIVEVEVTGTVD